MTINSRVCYPVLCIPSLFLLYILGEFVYYIPWRELTTRVLFHPGHLRRHNFACSVLPVFP